MNIVEENDFTAMLQETGRLHRKPKAVLVISAHWVTRGTYVSINARNQQQYDFSGFPSELYDIHYTPSGSPETAARIMEMIPHINGVSYAIDHGAWALLHQLFPHEDIPVLQLSIDISLSFREHLEIGKALGFLRDDGVLIIASGNVTHNLRYASFGKEMTIPQWAIEFDNYVADTVKQMNRDALVNDDISGDLFEIAHPTKEHYIPLFYALGAAQGEEALCIFEGFQNGSISMRSWRFGEF